MSKPIYRGEALVKRWGDSSNAGRTVTLEIDGDGEHPFKGYEGERFAVVIMPIGNDEQPMEKAPRERKRWLEMVTSARAAMLCDDPNFWRYLNATFGDGRGQVANILDKEAADKEMKGRVGIVSKKQLDDGQMHAAIFNNLDGSYRAWMQHEGFKAA